MRFTASVFLGLALLLFGNTARAQTPTQEQTPTQLTPEEKAKKEEEEKKVAAEKAARDGWEYFFWEEVIQRSCDDPTLRSAIALPQPKLILDVTDEGETKVKARVGVELGKKFVLSLDVASPRSSSDETTLASLEGLSKGGTADLSLSWYHVPWESETFKNELVRVTQRATGIQAGEGELDITSYANPVFSRPSAVAALGGPERYKEVVQEYRRWMRDKKINIPVVTLRGHAEERGFDFFVPAAGPPSGLKKTSESHTDWHLTGSVGDYFRGRAFLSLNYNYGTEFQNGGTKDFCIPSSLTGVLQCETLVIAPPEKKRTKTLEFEARGLTRSFGLAAHLTRDLQANVTMVEIPIYLLQKFRASEMELNLGARAQWRSDTREYAISVFVGPALSTVLRKK